MKEDFNLEKFKKEVAQKIREGKGLTGKEGALTPLLREILEAAMEGEMDQHLSESKQKTPNRRNGYTRKNLKSSLGAFDIATPRDREGSFSPQTVEKRQRVLPGDLDDKILSLYGRGMSYRDIKTQMEDIYGVDISEATISSITDRIIPLIRDWQSRPLNRIYPIIWMDAMHFKIRSEGQVKTKAIYTILGVDMEGTKDVLGLYMGDSESAAFWLQVLSDLQQRGVEDILIVSIDNLKGFADAIESIFPKAEVQLCVIHQVRNSLKYVANKNRKAFIKDLKEVYKANSKEVAEFNLDILDEKWGQQYPIVIKSWRNNWERLTAYFKYPKDIRRLVYTTNTVEGYHRMVRRLTKTKGAFTSETAALKLVYMAAENSRKVWIKGVQGWPQILNQLMMFYEDRILE